MKILTAIEFLKLQKKKKPRQDGEHQEQCKFFSWCRNHEKIYPQLKWIFAIPNGGLRNKRTGAKLKREGVLSGVFDVFLPSLSSGDSERVFYGLWIEFKFGKNTLSKKQREFLNEMQSTGYLAIVVYSAEEAIKEVKSYLGVKQKIL